MGVHLDTAANNVAEQAERRSPIRHLWRSSGYGAVPEAGAPGAVSRSARAMSAWRRISVFDRQGTASQSTADWKSAVSRIGNPQVSADCQSATQPISNRRYNHRRDARHIRCLRTPDPARRFVIYAETARSQTE
jgi:hypothetical protein